MTNDVDLTETARKLDVDKMTIGHRMIKINIHSQLFAVMP